MRQMKKLKCKLAETKPNDLGYGLPSLALIGRNDVLHTFSSNIPMLDSVRDMCVGRLRVSPLDNEAV